MTRRVIPRLVLPLLAMGLAAVLGGCVVYPAYPGYAAYPAYGYGSSPYYRGGYVAGGGGWR